MNNIYKIAKYFLLLDPEMTDKKVQKLVYYAYSWYLTKEGSRLFNESPQAWVHGPVFRSLFNEMKYYRGRFSLETPIEDTEIVDFLNKIYKVYGNLSGNELEELTHQESPWQIARKGIASYENSCNEIDDEDIRLFYSR